MKELPKYKSHKTVSALKIKDIKILGLGASHENIIYPEEKGYDPIKVSDAFMNKHKPRPGGYYVVYKDGYESWSPNDAFISGYEKIDDVKDSDIVDVIDTPKKLNESDVKEHIINLINELDDNEHTQDIKNLLYESLNHARTLLISLQNSKIFNRIL